MEVKKQQEKLSFLHAFLLGKHITVITGWGGFFLGGFRVFSNFFGFWCTNKLTITAYHHLKMHVHARIH